MHWYGREPPVQIVVAEYAQCLGLKANGQSPQFRWLDYHLHSEGVGGPRAPCLLNSL